MGLWHFVKWGHWNLNCDGSMLWKSLNENNVGKEQNGGKECEWQNTTGEVQCRKKWRYIIKDFFFSCNGKLFLLDLQVKLTWISLEECYFFPAPYHILSNNHGASVFHHQNTCNIKINKRSSSEAVSLPLLGIKAIDMDTTQQLSQGTFSPIKILHIEIRNASIYGTVEVTRVASNPDQKRNSRGRPRNLPGEDEVLNVENDERHKGYFILGEQKE